MLLTLVLAFLGIFVITRLVTSSVRERFVNQLYEASRVTADGVVRREQEHLSSLRLMTFTVGVPSAIENGNADSLANLLVPYALNEGTDAVVVVDEAGSELVSLIWDPAQSSYIRRSGSSFAQYDFVARVLEGGQDEAGDKFVGLVKTSNGNFLFTSGAVADTEGNVLGAILVGTQLESFVNDLKGQSLADIVLLNQQGELIATTFNAPEVGFAESGMLPPNPASISQVEMREFNLFGRTYQAAYSSWVVRDQVVGTLGVSLPSNFVVATEATSRNTFSLIFALGTVAVIVVGFVLSQNIAGPILRLRTMAQAVASGDLKQAAGIRRSDEIGELAAAFDVMTAKLSERTEAAERLYQETVERNKQLAEMYDRLQSAQQQLVQSEKLAAVGQLAAGIVHDVKNPLGVIKGMAEELMLESEGDPEMVQMLQIIRDNANRANLIVTDMLKFARQSTPSMHQRDLRETIEGCLRLTDYLIRKGHVEASSQVPEEPVWVTYDAQQIEQVLINLIQNAVQAMPEGGQLAIELEESNGQAVLRVSDSGQGIEADNLSRIFEPFFTTKPEGKGTGMGLAVSYGIVSRHGGQIEVESELGEGSTFEIRLPKEPSKDRQPQEVVA
jgi:signal transduction histidine kinase